MAGSLAQTYISWYHGVEHHFGEVAFELLINLVCQTQTRIVHGEQKAFNLQGRIKPRFNNADCIEELAYTLEGKVLGLNRDNHRVGGREGVDSDKAQRRRAVDEYEIVFVLHGSKQTLQHALAVGLADKLYFGSGQIYARPYNKKPVHAGGHLRAVDRITVDHALVD